MAKVAAFHSSNPNLNKKVYHDNSSCTEGNNIESKYKTSGTAGRPKCQRCTELG